MTTPTDAQTRVWDHPVTKWVSSILQALVLALVTWIGSNIVSAVAAFSTKLDGVVSSVATISQEVALQKRDFQDISQRTTKLESKVEALEGRSMRLIFQVEQLEKERANGR